MSSVPFSDDSREPMSALEIGQAEGQCRLGMTPAGWLRSTSKISGQRGLTIVEIVVVLIILSVLMTFLVTKVLGQGDRQKMEITRIKLKEVKLKIEEFQLRYNVLPSSLEALIECNEQTGSDCVPIVGDPSTLRDAWERPLVYTTTGDRSYQIKSLGADGKEGGSSVNIDVAENGP